MNTRYGTVVCGLFEIRLPKWGIDATKRGGLSCKKLGKLIYVRDVGKEVGKGI